MLQPGDTVDRYVVESIVGVGGMGAVYRAHDPRLDRAVALKVVHADIEASGTSRGEATARLLREARAAAKLDHPNAIHIYDVGEAGADAFIVMELVPGRTLRARMEDGSLSLAEKVRIMTDVARALAAAHRSGIVHRDVKPENIMIRDDGVVKVLDFGIARRAAGAVDPTAPTENRALLTLTAEGVRVGTPLYMTPEQIKGEALDGRSDQFAWAVVAWELFRGELPWKKTDAMSLAGEILLQSVGAPGVSPEIDALVGRALSKSPAERFPSMDEIVTALERCGVGPAVSSPPPARAPELPFARYSTEMTRAILSRAIERQAERAPAGYEGDDILAAAREVGVDDATLRAAERELLGDREVGIVRIDERTREWRALIQHFVAYVMVNVFLLVTLGWGWDQWVLFGWGIGMASHAAKVIFPTGDRGGSRAARRARRRERRRGSRPPKARIDPEIERAAAELVQTAAARRLRVAVSGSGQPAGEPVDVDAPEAERVEAAGARGRSG